MSRYSLVMFTLSLLFSSYASSTLIQIDNTVKYQQSGWNEGFELNITNQTNPINLVDIPFDVTVAFPIAGAYINWSGGSSTSGYINQSGAFNLSLNFDFVHPGGVTPVEVLGKLLVAEGWIDDEYSFSVGSYRPGYWVQRQVSEGFFLPGLTTSYWTVIPKKCAPWLPIVGVLCTPAINVWIPPLPTLVWVPPIFEDDHWVEGEYFTGGVSDSHHNHNDNNDVDILFDFEDVIFSLDGNNSVSLSVNNIAFTDFSSKELTASITMHKSGFPSSVPEPSSLVIFCLSLLILFHHSKKHTKMNGVTL